MLNAIPCSLCVLLIIDVNFKITIKFVIDHYWINLLSLNLFTAFFNEDNSNLHMNPLELNYQMHITPVKLLGATYLVDLFFV
jgi:hypothetical protein